MSLKSTITGDACFVCKEKSLHLHKIPKEKDRIEKWFKLLGKTELLEVGYNHLQRYAKICGRHFEDWAFTNTTKQRLIRFALPLTKQPTSIFTPTQTTTGQQILQKEVPLEISDDLKKSISSNVQLLLQKKQKDSEQQELDKTPLKGEAKKAAKIANKAQQINKGSNEVLQALQSCNKKQAFKLSVKMHPASPNSNEGRMEVKVFKISNEVQKTSPQKSSITPAFPEITEDKEPEMMETNGNDEVHDEEVPEKTSEVEEEEEAHHEEEPEEAPESGAEAEKTMPPPKRGLKVKQVPISGIMKKKKKKVKQHIKETNKEKRRLEAQQEKSRLELEEYLKRRKEVMQKKALQPAVKRNRSPNKTPPISPLKRSKVRQLIIPGSSGKTGKKMKLLKNSQEKIKLTLQKKKKRKRFESSDEEEQQQQASSDEESFPVIHTLPSHSRLAQNYVDAQRLIKNQRCVISKLKRRIEKLQQDKCKFVRDVKDQMNAEQYGFVMSQIQQCKRANSGLRWTTKDKIFALRIYLQSPDAYRILLQKLSFPSIPTLRKYARKIGITTS